MDGESPDERDARTRSLWKKLDTQSEGSLDVKAFKKGLKKIDHREHNHCRAARLGRHATRVNMRELT